MSQGKETTILVLSLLVTAGIAGGGYWFFSQQSKQTQSPTNSQPTTNSQPIPTVSSNSPQSLPTALSLDTSLPNPTVLEMDGTTAMVSLIKELRNAYAQINPNIPTTFGIPDGNPNGTGKGLQNLLNDKAAIAASSRPLKPEEAQAGVQLIPVARDTMAIIVGANNPFKGNLTVEQVRDIYTGKITNWSQLGGANAPIKVINRNVGSGGRDFFQDTVLLGQAFAPDSPNFITWDKSETTAILRAIGDTGISYATTSQVEKQEIIRIVPINGVIPTDQNAVRVGKYPITRNLFLGVKKKTSPAAKQFIEFTLSPQGQQIVQKLGFIPMQ